MEFTYNGARLIVDNINQLTENSYSAQLVMKIGDLTYGYDVVFDLFGGVVEWSDDITAINLGHKKDGNSLQFKGLLDAFNVHMSNRLNIRKEIKPKIGDVKITVSYDPGRKRIGSVSIKGLKLTDVLFNKLIQELSAQSVSVNHDDDKHEILINKNGDTLSDWDLSNITKILDKNNISTANIQTVDKIDVNQTPLSAIISSKVIGN